MPKSPKRKTLHVIARYFYQSATDIEAHIVKTYSAFNPEEWNITIHASTDTLNKKNCLRKREMLGEIQIRRSEDGFFGISPKIQFDKSDLICLYGFKLFPHVFILIKTLYLKIMGRKKFTLMLIPQGAYVPYWQKFTPLRRILKKIYHAVPGKILINLAVDGILTMSTWEKQQMIAANIREEIIVTIPDGVEPEAFEDLDKMASNLIKSKVNKYGNYILQIGRIHELKNYETTLKALSYLPDSIHLVIAGPIGDKKYMKHLYSIIKSQHMEKRVFFHGIIRSYDKYYLIKKAKLLVHMPSWDANGTILLEAMSQGLICIAANICAPSMILKDDINGYLLNPKDDLELGKKIHYLMNNNENPRLHHMKERNKTIIQDSKAARLQKKLEILYTSILMKKKYPYRLHINKSF